MKRTAVLITVGIIGCLGAAYFGYEKLLNKKPIHPWDLVPSEALAVYEKDACSDCLQELTVSSVWQVLEKAIFYQKPVDSVRKKINDLIKTHNEVLISVHATEKDDFDFVFYLAGENDLNRALSFHSGIFKTSTREFNSVAIHELRWDDRIFSFARIEKVWIGSFTPFLVEDVIRIYRKKGETFRDRYKSSAANIRDDAGNLYLQLKKIGEWFSLFSPGIPQAYPFGKNAVLDIKAQENALVLNGFSQDSIDHPAYLLSVFRHQSPVSFGLKNLITNRAIAVSNFGITDARSFGKDLRDFAKMHAKSLQDTLAKISGKNFNPSGLYSSIADEISACFLEAPRGGTFSKVLLIETGQKEKWLQSFHSLSERYSIDTVFYERYSTYEIREVPVFKFSEKLFWPLVTGFEHNYYTSVGNAIVIGDNLEALKNFLNDIDTDETWGRSVTQNRFLESTLLESNVSLYFNPSRAWSLLYNDLNPRWRSFVRENQGLLQSLSYSSVQFSHLNNNFYTNFLFTYKPYSDSKERTANRLVINFDRGIYKLDAVKSHVNHTNELLVQDSLYDLSLISAEGKLLWRQSIGDRIVSDVVQIDFFGNGKLQYLFATKNVIHVIDRLGNYVDPYPLVLSKAEIEFLSVVDYDNSKKYRFLIADRSGKLWMYDKQGTNLEGWNPKDIKGSLMAPARHYRIVGKDFVIAIRKDGTVYLVNRKGENVRKYPLNLESVPAGNYFLEMGSSQAESYFVVVTRDGYRMRFNPEGKIQSKETLLRTSVTASFSLIREKSNKSYLILQQDGKQVTLADESGKRIVSSPIQSIAPENVNYYDFGSGNVFITLTDRIQGLSYIYDGQGTLISNRPIETTDVEIRPQNTDQFFLYFIQGKSLVMQPLQD